METPSPSPTPVPSTDPATVVHLAQLAPEQWQFVALGILVVVFVAGVLLAVKL